MYTHSILRREQGVFVPTGHDVVVNHDEPLESIIKSCDDLARNAAKTSTKEEVFAYRVGEFVEYAVSSAFFMWRGPNE
ncbi:MAG: hypothetical protein EBS53_05030 [Bacteroidetes bacterium]|jgi:hypothetical protein|nr:hypothetical protein [Bacteroidota bacterium]